MVVRRTIHRAPRSFIFLRLCPSPQGAMDSTSSEAAIRFHEAALYNLCAASFTPHFSLLTSHSSLLAFSLSVTSVPAIITPVAIPP